MRAAVLVAAAVLMLPFADTARAAADLDDAQKTECKGDRCVGSSCNADGDATNCWQESVYHRKPGEEVHWVCTKHGHRCSWLHGPLPDQDKWNVLEFGGS
jgi:hypothetical protein